MWPINILAAKPLILNHKRLIAMNSGYQFGNPEISENHHLEKLEEYLKSFQNGNHLEKADQMFRKLDRPVYEFKSAIPSEILMSDADPQYQYHHLNEKFHKKPTLESIRPLMDVSTRMHFPICRGLERHLLKYLNALDGEVFLRQELAL